MAKKWPDELVIDTDLVRSVLERFIRSHVRDAGLNGVVVGVSGGVDSAVATYLAASALGRDGVTGLLLPFRTSGADAKEDAINVINDLGIRYEEIRITPMVETYERNVGKLDDIRLGNVCARMRMIILFDRSKEYNAIVMGTGNKTEALLGYATVFGDMACSINPLGDLYKGQVYQLAEALGVPRKIIEKTPTADLWPGQTDEGEMGLTYLDVDRYFYYLVEKGKKPAELRDMGFEPAFQRNVIERVNRNLFKRELPIIAKVSGKTVKRPIRIPGDF
jgi:NAD+ synthase